MFKGWSEASWATSGIPSYTPTGDGDIYYACWIPDPNYVPPSIPITDCAITLSQTSYIYDGSAKTPDVTVKYGDKSLAYGVDYALAYFNNVNVGTATVSVIGIGGYTGSVNRTFTINAPAKTDIANCEITLSQTTYTYDGTEKKPEVYICYPEPPVEPDYSVSTALSAADSTELTATAGDGSYLTQGADYSLSYSDNINAGTATVTITGMGDYEGEVSKSFTIEPKSISFAGVTLSQTSYSFDDSEKEPDVTVTDGSVTLTNGADYTVAYANNKNAGTATVTVTGIGNYTGSSEAFFTILDSGKTDIAQCSVTLSWNTYTYDGQSKEPTVTVKDGSKTLAGGTDYTVSYYNNVNAGSATVTVTGIGAYTGLTTKNYTINAKPISQASVALSGTAFTYDGTAKKPTVTVKDGSKTLTNSSDYYVTYKDNTDVGVAKAMVTGLRNYTGTVQKEFTIQENPKVDLSDCTVTLSQTSYTYDGSEKKPTVTVKHGSKALTLNTDYTVAYSNNIDAGTAKVTVTGKGSYTGSIIKEFSITISKPEFVWGQDNWNFNNSSYNGYFLDSTYREQINSDYLNVLKANLNNSEYITIFGADWYPYAWLDNEWGGSCYGMSSLTLLAKQGLLPYSDYKSGATTLHDLDYPVKDDIISSLVTYYQMLQVKDVIQQQYRTVPYRSNETNIKEIMAQLDKNPTVLVCFGDEYSGHAVIATGYEFGSYSWDGVTYQGCIKTCDPNSSIEYDKEFNIYFNTQSYNWTIPVYSGIGYSSAGGAAFDYVGANVSEINEGGYLSGISANQTEQYVARIDAYSIAANRTVTKVRESSGGYISMSSAPGDIIEDYSHIFGNELRSIIGYNLFDSTASYKVAQDNPVNLDLVIDYQNSSFYGSSKAGKTVIFDPNGYVMVEGESADFDLGMVYNEDYPTDWFSLHVKGKNANTASLKMTDEGYILKSDCLENVQVFANNKEVSATLTFSTDYDSVLLYEIDERTIGVLVDTDNDGTYDTNLFEAPTESITIKGDVNSDGEVDNRDAMILDRYVAEWAGYADRIKNMDAADLDRKGSVDNRDAMILDRVVAGWTGYYEKYCIMV